MTTLDVGIAALRSSLTALRAAADRGYKFYDRTSATLKGVMPKGLYGRALLMLANHCRSIRSGHRSGLPSNCNFPNTSNTCPPSALRASSSFSSKVR